MENNENTSQAEIYALKPIAKEERMSWISMAFVQAGICVCIPSFLVGAILSDCMNIGPAIAASIIGNIIIVIGMVVLGMMGSDLGVATCTLAQSSLGVKGARYLVSGILLINLIGWFGINNAVCGEAFSNALLDVWGISISYMTSSLIWGFIMLSSAIFGMKAMEKLDKLAIPLLMIIMLIGTFLAIQQFGLDNLNSEIESTMTIAQGVGLTFNFMAVGVVASSDFTRYQKTRKDVCKSTFWGMFPMGVITAILGVLLTKIANEYDISLVLITVGIPLLGVTAMVLASWTTNSSNAYTAALSTTMIFNIPDNRRREVTVVVGIIGTLLGAFGILYYLETVLSMLACVVAPIGGVMLADYWVVGKGKPQNWHAVKGFNWAGVIAWIIGAVIAYCLYIEYLGIIIAFIIYLVLEHFMPSPSRGNGVAKERIVSELETSVIILDEEK